MVDSNYRNRAESLTKAGLASDHPLVTHFNEIYNVLNTVSNISDKEQAKRGIIYQAVSSLPDDKRPKASYNLVERQEKLTERYPMLQFSDIYNVGYWGGYYYSKKRSRPS